MTFSLAKKIAAEGLGTAFLVAIVIGSGIMGETLSPENDAVALLANSAATGAGLCVLIAVFGPVSGAHFNPAVTLAFAVRRDIAPTTALVFVGAQCVGAVAGAMLTHAMFEQDLLQVSVSTRDGPGRLIGEATATFGLVLTIFGGLRVRPGGTAALVGLWIAAGYWFTSSTSFANPAVTLARTLSDTFAGIRPADAPGFIAAQTVGALLATGLSSWLFATDGRRYRPADAGPPQPIPNAR
ncbi:MAG: MIP/aquaporin family protein [Parvularculaceae bacterium]